MNSIELKREKLQHELDAQKELSERNKMGQYSTPYPLAHQICTHLKGIIGSTINSVLEPAIGTGVFYSALHQLVSFNKFVGYEIDSHYYTPSASLWSNHDIQLINQDFLESSISEKFSLIISNPPYSRHHHIPSDKKKLLAKKIKDLYDIEVSGLSGLYVYFIILSTYCLQKDGYSCWLVPSEFLTVNYGCPLKQFLLDKVDLISIHSFTSEDVQFSDALVSSSIIIFKNRKPSDSPVSFSWGGSLQEPKETANVAKENLQPEGKWTKDFLQTGIGIIADKNSPKVTLGDFFTIKRGIATGDNSFFIINKETISKFGITQTHLTPIIPPPRKLSSDIFSDTECDKAGLSLITCNKKMEDLKKTDAGLYDYLNYGIEKNVNQRANCKNRELWYKCEQRDTAPILVSYMGRDNGKSPIRFILNEAKATASNSYLMLYPKNEYQHLFKDSIFVTKIWKLLSSIPKQTLMAYGRTYGGGLLKWEPTELAAVPCAALKSLLKSNSPSLFDF